MAYRIDTYTQCVYGTFVRRLRDYRHVRSGGSAPASLSEMSGASDRTLRYNRDAVR